MKKLLILFCCLLPVILKAQIITTIAGNGSSTYTGDGGPATVASIGGVGGIATDKSGNVYIAELNNTVRKISPAGIITTIAGNGTAGFSGDGLAATATQLNFSGASIATDTSGNVYVADFNNNRVRKIDVSTGIITTYAGNGLAGFSGDGVAATSTSLSPIYLWVDRQENLLIVDALNYRIRKVNPLGIISTIVGTGTSGFAGDGGPATAALLFGTSGLCTDSAGNIYVPDNNRIRKIDLTNTITTIVGDGTYGFSGDGLAATAAKINVARDVVVDQIGNLYISDNVNHRIRIVDTFNIINTFTGNGVGTFSGDGGVATAAQIYSPRELSVDICGNLLIVDNGNRRIRKITTDSPIISTPTIALSGGISFPLGSTVPVTATVSGAGSSYIIYWMNHGITFTSTTVPSVTYTKGPGIDTITAKVVSTAAYGCFDSTISSGHIVSVGALGVTNATTHLSIYPNPTNDLLHIDNLQANAGYRILSIVGAEILEGVLRAGRNELSIRDLPPGMYLLEVTEDNERTMMRVVKQ